MLLWIFLYKFLRRCVFSVSQSWYPRAGMLSHLLSVYLFHEMPNCFLKWLPLVTVSPAGVSASWSAVGVFWGASLGHCNRDARCIPLFFWICVFLETNGVEHLFLCFFNIAIFSLEKISIRVLCPFFSWLLLNYWVVYIFRMLDSHLIGDLQIFPLCALSSHSLSVLRCTGILSLDEVQFICSSLLSAVLLVSYLENIA